MERFFHVGDTCKRSFEDVMSGIILSHNAQVKLRHAISDLQPRHEWIDEDLLTFASDVNIGGNAQFRARSMLIETNNFSLTDFVVYNDWLGQVEEVCKNFYQVYLILTLREFRFSKTLLASYRPEPIE